MAKLTQTQKYRSIGEKAIASFEENSGKSFASTQAQVNALNNIPNEFYTELDNIFINVVKDMLNYEDGVSAFFFKAGEEFATITNVINQGIIEPVDFDETKFIPEAQLLLPTYVSQVKTNYRKVFKNTISQAQLKAAFSGPMEFGKFITLQTKKLYDSFQIWLNKTFTAELLSVIVNTKDVSTITPDKFYDDDLFVSQFAVIFEDASVMATYSKDFNAGYTLGNGQLITSSKPEDLALIMNPRDYTKFLLKPIARFYHSDKWNTDNFVGKVIKSPAMPEGKILLADYRAFWIQKRIDTMATQFWASNLTLSQNLHVWLNTGIIAVAPARVYTLTAPAVEVETE